MAGKLKSRKCPVLISMLLLIKACHLYFDCLWIQFSMSCDGILFYPITDLCGFFFIIEPLFGKGIKNLQLVG